MRDFLFRFRVQRREVTSVPLSLMYSDVSRHSEISIQCYLRTEEPKRGGDGIADDMGNDIYLGGVRFMPDFDETNGEDQWYDLAGGQGRIQIAVAFKPSSVCVSRRYVIGRCSDFVGNRALP